MALLVASIRWQLGVFVTDHTIVTASAGSLGVYWYIGVSPRATVLAMTSSAGPFYVLPQPVKFVWLYYMPEDPSTGGLGVALWIPAAGLLGYGWCLWRQSRDLRGHCRRCRYDLSGLPPGAPCPECGQNPTVVA